MAVVVGSTAEGVVGMAAVAIVVAIVTEARTVVVAAEVPFAELEKIVGVVGGIAAVSVSEALVGVGSVVVVVVKYVVVAELMAAAAIDSGHAIAKIVAIEVAIRVVEANVVVDVVEFVMAVVVVAVVEIVAGEKIVVVVSNVACAVAH